MRRFGRLLLPLLIALAIVPSAVVAWGREARTGEDAGNELVTIIVQLEEQQGATTFGLSQESRHEYFRDLIRDAAEQQAEQQTGDQPSAVSVDGPAVDGSAADSLVEDVADYYHVIDGFAVRAPESVLDDIRAMDGVKRAFVEQSYEVPTDQGQQTTYRNESSLSMTGADQVQASYKGDGQVIAIIDSGVDLDHEAFGGSMDGVDVELTEDRVNALKSELGTGSEGTYVSSKIPFGYDYSNYDPDADPGPGGMDHGTHVAGIAAANGGDEIVGVAPNAQILAMKVTRDEDGAIFDSSVIAALDDCAVLLPDVINMSFGSPGGFSSTEADELYSEACQSLEDLGVMVVACAGNAYSSASYNQSGVDLSYASDPDTGIVDSPSSLTSVLSVASVNNKEGRLCFSASDGTDIAYKEAMPYGVDSIQLFTGLADGTYTYVDCGKGSLAELEERFGADGTMGERTIALIERGATEPEPDLTFNVKVEHAARYGATAVIVYDNVDEDLLDVGIVDSDYPPLAVINKADGEHLLSLLDQGSGTITVTQGQRMPDAESYTMSDFSSLGVTPELTLKPDISAPGGDIYSSVLDDEYAYQSGTSMSSPQMAGIMALMREYVESDSRFAGMDEGETGELITQLLMSTAVPLQDPAVPGSYYSPRKQGAGIASVAAATTTEVYATVDEAADASRSKANLGESETGAWSFTVTLHNMGEKDRTFELDAVALSEQIADGLFQEHSDDWTDKGIEVSLGGAAAGGAVTVPEGRSASVTVGVTCGPAFTEWVAANAPNGTFVDGFVMFASTDGGVDLSVPFLGFYGDWSQAPVFDGQLAGDYHLYGSNLVSGADYSTLLGVNPLDTDALRRLSEGDWSVVDPQRAVISRSDAEGAPRSAMPRTGLLRGVGSLTYTVRNDLGETVWEGSLGHTSKSAFADGLGAVVCAEAWRGLYYEFDGTDAQGNQLPDGSYTLTRSATTVGPTPETQVDKAVAVLIDTVAPSVAAAGREGSGDDVMVSFTVTDATYLAGLCFYDPETGEEFYRHIPEDDGARDESGEGTWSVEIPVAEIRAAWDAAQEGKSGEAGEARACPDVVEVRAFDYGLNGSEKLRVSLAEGSGEAVDPEDPEDPEGQGEAETPDTPGDSADSGDQQGQALPETSAGQGAGGLPYAGDSSMVPVAAFGAAGTLALVVGSVMWVRSRQR